MRNAMQAEVIPHLSEGVVRRGPVLPVTEESIDVIVRELNELVRTDTIESHLKLGRLILNRIYAGDLGLWRRHGPKELSFRKLAARAGRDLVVSASSLYRAVVLCEFADRHPFSTWKHLSVSHIRAVIGLAEGDQRRLMASAADERWTVQRMESEVSALRNLRGDRRGRPALLPFVKTVRRLATLLEQPPRSLAGLDKIDALTDEEIRNIRQMILAVRQHLDSVEKKLSRRSSSAPS